MKKGLTHVDWTISIALFIVYILVIIIIFKPTIIKEEYTGEFLSSIVEQGFKDYSYVNIERTPLFIEAVTLIPAGTSNLEVKNINFWIEGNSTIVDESLTELNFDFTPPDSRAQNDVFLADVDVAHFAKVAIAWKWV